MAGQSIPATTLLDRCGANYRLHSYPHDSRTNSYGSEAADALRLAPQRVFKTLIAEIDISVREHETVFCSAGRRGLQLELTPETLLQAAKATVVAIALY
jgi:prolyl-tRNA editing enzyme YbaK/EbsC (Cys-tRNA(Pro) deacylase)